MVLTFALIAVVVAVLAFVARGGGASSSRARDMPEGEAWARLVGLCHGDEEKAERLADFEQRRAVMSRQQAIASAIERLLDARNR